MLSYAITQSYMTWEQPFSLLPSGSEQHEVMLFGSIQEGILQASQYILQTEKDTLKVDIVG